MTRFTEFSTPFDVTETETDTKKALDDGFNAENAKVRPAVEKVAGAIGEIDATLVFDGSEQHELVASLRGFTWGKGWRFEELWRDGSYGSLYSLLREHLNSNNYNAARLYLQGRNAEGAAYELEESTGYLNDDETRMENAMRALSPDELHQLDEAPSNSRMGRMRDHARDVLGGVDRNVFDALRRGNYARADAYRFQEAQQANLRNRNADASHTTIRSYVSAPQAGSWGQNPTVTADQRRQMIANGAGQYPPTRGGVPTTTNLSEDQQQANLQAMADFATGTYTYTNPYRPQDGERTRTTWTGANHDLARDLVLHGQNSREARGGRHRCRNRPAARTAYREPRYRAVRSRGSTPILIRRTG